MSNRSAKTRAIAAKRDQAQPLGCIPHGAGSWNIRTPSLVNAAPFWCAITSPGTDVQPCFHPTTTDHGAAGGAAPLLIHHACCPSQHVKGLSGVSFMPIVPAVAFAPAARCARRTALHRPASTLRCNSICRHRCCNLPTIDQLWRNDPMLDCDRRGR